MIVAPAPTPAPAPIPAPTLAPNSVQTGENNASTARVLKRSIHQIRDFIRQKSSRRENQNGSISRQVSATSNNISQGQNPDVGIQSTIILPSVTLAQQEHNQRLEKARQLQQQQRPGTKYVVVFIGPDQVRMKSLLENLSGKNNELTQLLELPDLSFENPLLHIRNGADRPTLWQDNELVRDDLFRLHETLTDAKLMLEDSPLKLAIQLETKDSSVLNWVRANGLDGELVKRLRPNFFRLLGLPPSETDPKLLVAGTISSPRSGQRLENSTIQDKLAAVFEQSGGNSVGAKYIDIGDLDFDRERAFNIRHITAVDGLNWEADESLDRIIGKDWEEFSYVARIKLAAQIALGYIQFASANDGFMAREAKHYRFFRKSSENKDWTQAWLDNGFGSPIPQPADGAQRSPREVEASRVNAAKELGRLLYQLTSGHKLDNSEYSAQDNVCIQSLHHVSDQCGGYVSCIVKACFSTVRRSGQQDPSYVIIEEVAYALERLASELNKETEREQRRTANIVGGEPGLTAEDLTPRSSNNAAVVRQDLQAEGASAVPVSAMPAPVQTTEVLTVDNNLSPNQHEPAHRSNAAAQSAVLEPGPLSHQGETNSGYQLENGPNPGASVGANLMPGRSREQPRTVPLPASRLPLQTNTNGAVPVFPEAPDHAPESSSAPVFPNAPNHPLESSSVPEEIYEDRLAN
ncbi:hypothetical protein NQ176_g6938 [Zarea fungicola]|uniref:Uncharacterized protein n=1 Tax=Zarea fungicola TaxID=93591 RepID=A0ACC1N1D5_9HYPO|nr:hypothetical protein NQ176_g6938 [Lecanicillium fungicola]